MFCISSVNLIIMLCISSVNLIIMFCISSVNFSVCSTSIKLSMLVKSILTQSPVALWAISYIIVDLVFSSITSYIVGYQLYDSGFSF